MKLKLLCCLLVGFTCFVRNAVALGSLTCEDEKMIPNGNGVCECPAGQYFQDGGCLTCPEVSGNDSGLYSFIKYDESDTIASCAVKLNLDKSKCGAGTTVIYKYSTDDGKYVLDTANYTVVPDDGALRNFSLASNAPQSFNGYDHCAECAAGMYFNTSANKCQLCEGAKRSFSGTISVSGKPNYSFVKRTDEDAVSDQTSCTIMLNINKSKCGEGTNVVYSYNLDPDTNTWGYQLYGKEEDYKLVPDDGYFKLYDKKKDVPVDDGLVEDHCGSCPLGYYGAEKGGLCEACPLEGTNAKNAVSKDWFSWIKYGDGIGVSSCALKRDATLDYCSPATNIVYAYNENYVYDGNPGAYVRVTSDVFTSAVSVNVKDLPDVDNLDGNFCQPCEEKYYNVGGECHKCNAAGLYLTEVEQEYITCASGLSDWLIKEQATDFSTGEEDAGGFYVSGSKGISAGGFNVHPGGSKGGGTCATEYVCKTCPAGHYCPAVDGDATASEPKVCGPNSYSEPGAGECTPCASGYLTTESGPADSGRDGFCLFRGKYVCTTPQGSNFCTQATIVACNDGDSDCFGYGCVTPDACKLAMSTLSVTQSDGSLLRFVLGNSVRIDSLNKSVVKFPTNSKAIK